MVAVPKCLIEWIVIFHACSPSSLLIPQPATLQDSSPRCCEGNSSPRCCEGLFLGARLAPS
eukprot:7205194-Pyramimonas_sp.AAC.1